MERQERLDLECNEMEKTEGGKKKNERRKGTKERRQEMNQKMREPTKE